MQLPSRSLSLTPRDQAIIQMVYDYGGCGAQHIHHRFWPPDSSLSACYRRLSRLIAGHYLVNWRLPSLTGQGSGKSFLTLGLAGRRLIAVAHELPLRSLGRTDHVATPLFIAHHFAICDTRVAFEQAVERVPAIDLVSWTPELKLRRHPMRVTDPVSHPAERTSPETITLVPDGAFQLRVAGRSHTAYLEQDMGTIAPKRLARKLRGYLLAQKDIRRVTPIFFVTSSTSREERIAALAVSEAKRVGMTSSIFFVTTRGRVTADTILQAPIWLQAGVATRAAIIPPGHTRAPEAQLVVSFEGGTR